MSKKVFFKKSDEAIKVIKKQASTSYHVATSTPNCSRDVEVQLKTHEFPDMSVICVDRSVSPILVSDASIADLNQTIHKCHCSKKSKTRNQKGILKSSPRSSNQSQQTSFSKKRASVVLLTSPSQSPCASTSSLKRLQKREQSSACNQTESCSKGKDAKCGCDVEQLYFNPGLKSGCVGHGARCGEECDKTHEASTSKPCANLTKDEIDDLNRTFEKIFKESGSCSLGSAAAGSCDAARAQYYHNKLLATLQILQNKEETIRVQAESLAVAEGRIAALSARAAELRRELDRKTKELMSLQSTLDCSRAQTVDVSIMADEAGDQTGIVKTLENNLSVIEELYRECFYETAKQESLIELLRKSYLDVRLSDRQKADHIGRLTTVIHTQRSSLERCQDIAMEVDSLKAEISNFLNSATSNNDSGVWEARSEGPPPSTVEDLHDMMEQLLRLRDILTSGCICGLEQENKRLKQSNEVLEMNISELRSRMCELQCELQNKDSLDETYKQEIDCKEKELYQIRQRLLAYEDCSTGQTTCEALTTQLKQAHELLEDKRAELCELQRQCAAQENTIACMKSELDKADTIIKENCKIRGEMSHLSDQLPLWRAQLADSARRAHTLEDELHAARARAAHVDACYREKASNAAELQAQLEAAHARGAALCGEARRAVGAVRLWLRRMRCRQREQDTVIQEKDALITSLQERLGERLNDTRRSCASENGPSCSKCATSRKERECPVSIGTGSCCAKVEKRRGLLLSSGSEMASCSSAPVPPRRLLRKKGCAARTCACAAARDAVRDACSQGPERCDARTSQLCFRLDRFPRDVSPTEELFLRVEQLSDALADGQRRWTRPREER